VCTVLERIKLRTVGFLRGRALANAEGLTMAVDG
jgi:hypothetical protein